MDVTVLDAEDLEIRQSLKGIGEKMLGFWMLGSGDKLASV